MAAGLEYRAPILRRIAFLLTSSLHLNAPRAALSAVLITRNAANVLEPCLDSLAFADEIVVVDSTSNDGTTELAARRGARVVQKEWLGFGRQKQFAVEQAAHDWVLCLDADERVSPELAASVVRTMHAPTTPVYRMARRVSSRRGCPVRHLHLW